VKPVVVYYSSTKSLKEVTCNEKSINVPHRSNRITAKTPENISIVEEQEKF
jgi:hypothetical protein